MSAPAVPASRRAPDLLPTAGTVAELDTITARLESLVASGDLGRGVGSHVSMIATVLRGLVREQEAHRG